MSKLVVFNPDKPIQSNPNRNEILDPETELYVDMVLMDSFFLLSGKS